MARKPEKLVLEGKGFALCCLSGVQGCRGWSVIRVADFTSNLRSLKFPGHPVVKCWDRRKERVEGEVRGIFEWTFSIATGPVARVRESARDFARVGQSGRLLSTRVDLP